MASDGNVGDVLSALSHDLRSPTATMMLWLRLLRSAPDDASLRERGLDALEHSAKTLQKLINDVVLLARLENGHFAPSARAGQLELAAHAAVRARRAAAAERSLKMRVSTTATPGAVRFDPNRLRDAMGRMLDAALLLAAEQTTIVVESSTFVFAVQVQLRDDTPAALLAVALESFPPRELGTVSYLHSATLDVAVARSLVRLDGADITIRACAGGNELRIELQLGARSERARPARTDLDGIRLLVVDDQPVTLEVMTELLRRAGARVESATNTSEARAVLATQEIDVIACDLSMPGESGAEFLRERRARGCTTPAIALTGYTSASEIDNAHACGFDAYVAKPVEIDALVTLIGDLAPIRNP